MDEHELALALIEAVRATRRSGIVAVPARELWKIRVAEALWSGNSDFLFPPGGEPRPIDPPRPP